MTKLTRKDAVDTALYALKAMGIDAFRKCEFFGSNQKKPTQKQDE